MSRLSSLTFHLYRWILAPLLIVAFRLLAKRHQKIRAGLEMRAPATDGQPPWLHGPTGQRPIWIHCASFEFEYAKPVITELKKHAPQAKILVTYFSPTVASAVARFPGVDFACPAPWDRVRDCRAFIEYHRPRVLLIARTDTWPEMLHQARVAGIPSALFSATLDRAAGRARGLGRLLSRAVFGDLTRIFCVSEEDRAVFARLGFADHVQVAGDTRYDQVLTRLRSQQKPLRDELFADDLPLLVAGSTWAEDEAVLIETARAFRERLRFVFVPHEPTEAHLEDLESRIRAAGLESRRYSRTTSWPQGSILLVDQIGILAELYRKGRFAFVGGSFRKTVHSVMEPLAAGCLTFVGPLHHNNREALEFRNIPLITETKPQGRGQQSSAPLITCVQPVKDAITFTRLLEVAVEMFNDENRARILSEIHARSGKSELIAQWALEKGSSII